MTLNGVSVLIVDDETDARELMVAMLGELRRRRYTRPVRPAEALDVLKGGAFEPDVLVSDVGMADTDGFALIRTIREAGRRARRARCRRSR